MLLNKAKTQNKRVLDVNQIILLHMDMILEGLRI